MSFSCLTEEEKKQYIVSVVVSILVQKFSVTEEHAERLIAASSLQRMLDDGYVDYVLDSDENYWIDQIVANNAALRTNSKPAQRE